MVRIIYGNRIGIIKNCRRINKINTMFIEVYSCLIVIPFELI